MLRGGDALLFACFYRSPTPTVKSDDKNGTRTRKLIFRPCEITLLRWEEEYLILGCVRNKGELWNHLKSKIYDLRDQFVPKTTISGKPSWNKNGSIPIAKPVQKAMRQKITSHQRCMSAKNRTDGHEII